LFTALQPSDNLIVNAVFFEEQARVSQLFRLWRRRRHGFGSFHHRDAHRLGKPTARELLAIWRSGKTEADVFPDALVVVRGWQCGHSAMGSKASGLSKANGCARR
jgi:hypothetical protein